MKYCEELRFHYLIVPPCHRVFTRCQGVTMTTKGRKSDRETGGQNLLSQITGKTCSSCNISSKDAITASKRRAHSETGKGRVSAHSRRSTIGCVNTYSSQSYSLSMKCPQPAQVLNARSLAGGTWQEGGYQGNSDG